MIFGPTKKNATGSGGIPIQLYSLLIAELIHFLIEGFLEFLIVVIDLESFIFRQSFVVGGNQLIGRQLDCDVGLIGAIICTHQFLANGL